MCSIICREWISFPATTHRRGRSTRSKSEALAKLWHDEDVVVKSAGDDYRMLGSLRAAKQCLDCHSVQRGELLGAFSYSLRHEAASKR